MTQRTDDRCTGDRRTGAAVMDDVQVQLSLTDADPLDLGSVVAAGVAAGVEAFHVDIADGHFNPDIVHNVRLVGALATATAVPVDVHLMVAEPEWWIRRAAEAGAARVAFHVEATRYPLRCVQACRAVGVSPTLAINLATDPAPLGYVMALVDRVNLLSTEPDGAGELFAETTLERVERVARMVPPGVRLQVDGGVRPERAAALVDRGARDLVVGRALLQAPSMLELVRRMTDADADGR